jgi:hypothetical protein
MLAAVYADGGCLVLWGKIIYVAYWKDLKLTFFCERNLVFIIGM